VCSSDLSYLKTDDQTLTITCSFQTNTNPNTYLRCPSNNSSNLSNNSSNNSSNLSNNSLNKSLNNSSNIINTSEGVVIRFKPSIKIVEGDTITFSDTTFYPNYDGDDEFQVIKIISPSCIIVNMSNIQRFTSSGTFTLHTSMSNRILDQAVEGIKTTGDVVTKIGVETVDVTGDIVTDVGTKAVDTGGEVITDVGTKVLDTGGKVITDVGTETVKTVTNTLKSVGGEVLNQADNITGGALSKFGSIFGDLSSYFYIFCCLVCFGIIFYIFFKLIRR
jgi:hypothetical protein